MARYCLVVWYEFTAIPPYSQGRTEIDISGQSNPKSSLSEPFGAFGARCRNLIALLAGDDASDPAAGLLDIALVAGDEVDMGMGHGLAGGGMDIDPHIETVGVELPLEDGFDLIQEDKAVRLLLEGQVKVVGAMPGGDH